MFFVFSSLVEFAFVNALSRQTTKEEKLQETIRLLVSDVTQDIFKIGKRWHVDILQDRSDVTQEKQEKIEDLIHRRKHVRVNVQGVRNIDKASRVLFPLSFFLFNVVYWTVYLVPW